MINSPRRRVIHEFAFPFGVHVHKYKIKDLPHKVDDKLNE